MNKSFRIKESPNGNFATIWPISEEMFSVKWDHWENSIVFDKEDVEDCLAKGIWTKLPEQEEDLPRTFRFQHKDGGTIYTFVNDNGEAVITWDGCKAAALQYSIENVRNYIARGTWIVLPSEPEKEHGQDILEHIKEFTKQGHDVIISSGTYHVYPAGADNPYICPDKESLLEVMGAIETLDSYGG